MLCAYAHVHVHIHVRMHMHWWAWDVSRRGPRGRDLCEIYCVATLSTSYLPHFLPSPLPHFLPCPLPTFPTTYLAHFLPSHLQVLQGDAARSVRALLRQRLLHRRPRPKLSAGAPYVCPCACICMHLPSPPTFGRCSPLCMCMCMCMCVCVYACMYMYALPPLHNFRQVLATGLTRGWLAEDHSD